VKTKKLIITDSVSIRRKVHNYVREQILSGEIEAGERLIETKIAAEIGTSRTPVREALHSLEMEGLIESIPRVGYAVKPISDKEVEEICDIRTAIEGLAAGWALQKAQEKVVKELRKNVATAEERLARGQITDFIDLDAQFHEIIAKHSGSTRLLELAQTLRRHMLRYRTQSIYSPENVTQAIEGHKRIIAALEAGDADAVRQAVSFHLQVSKEDIIHYAFGKSPEQKAGRK
jgi:GntR family transcriptional regulator, rspAB operon transcriptional repressor